VGTGRPELSERATVVGIDGRVVDDERTVSTFEYTFGLVTGRG